MWLFVLNYLIRLRLYKIVVGFAFVCGAFAGQAQSGDILTEKILTQPVQSYLVLNNQNRDSQPIEQRLQTAFLQHLLGLNEELSKNLSAISVPALSESIELQAIYYFLQGANAGKKGHYKQAVEHLVRAQNITHNLDSSRLWVLASQEMAYTQALQENFEEAFNTLQLAFQRAQSEQDTLGLALAEQSLAAIYSYADNYQQALANYKSALTRYKQLAYPAYIAETLLGIATTLRHSQQWDKALSAYEEYAKALSFQNDVGSKFFYHYGKGITLALSGRCREAIPEINAAVDSDAPRDYLSELHKKSALCSAANGDVEQAKVSLEQAKFIIDNSPELQNTLWQTELLLIESEIAKSEGNYEAALALFRSYHSTYIKLQSKKTSDNLIRLKSKLESERKDAEIELLSQRTKLQALELVANKAKQQNRLVITIGAIVVALLLMIIALFQYWKSKQLYQLSVKDMLTGLFNRRYAIELMSSWLVPQRHKMQNWTVIMIDIDHFKQVNDTFGHAIGDQLLKAMADEASQVVRPSDMLARFGGEEFICALTRIEPEEAEKIAERLREQLANVTIAIPGNNDSKQVNCTASIGVAHIRQDDTDLNKLLERADKALYEAKHQGRNCVVVAD
ncbi:hypothetical protein GLIP_1814 [Aliiglaciecola lipolytica E3]|uniref:diguanylate cyclase n=1 Tax=Aliiglaciecola lipolytica E3 TaxID=1127673 RepID=K6YCT7_9ALTE|nr:hypothetical protein GLIP_1814 [Aliiglaciecola lipolytica E3]